MSQKAGLTSGDFHHRQISSDLSPKMLHMIYECLKIPLTVDKICITVSDNVKIRIVLEGNIKLGFFPNILRGSRKNIILI